MHVIITLAGHSKRFFDGGYNLPKFLLPVMEKTVIEKVIEMFSERDTFHFVLNTKQAEQYPDLIKILENSVPNNKIYVIQPHDTGPLYSCLQADIPEDESVIISYCDFHLVWNYENLINDISNYEGAIVAFKGFHPASFGSTFYAYMRVDSKNELLELKEKSSFTQKREEEPASCGIYYFKKWGQLKHYAEKVFEKGFHPLTEAYVTLPYIYMLEDSLKIKVTFVDKFICWGTPSDMDQYYFWKKYFFSHDNKQSCFIENQLNLIPAAGEGNRFKEYGYNTLKPLILIDNIPMITKASSSFPKGDRWIFILPDRTSTNIVSKELEGNFGQVEILKVKQKTQGQAETCLLAEAKINPMHPLFIASCDYEMIYDQHKFKELVGDKTIDAIIFTCRMGSTLSKNYNAFAYCQTEASQSATVTKIVEKKTISNDPGKDPLVIGSFWFRYAKDFVDCAKNTIKNDIRVNNEYYVASSMNYLIDRGKKILIFDVNQWITYGDPFELNIYEFWQDYFYNEKFK